MALPTLDAICAAFPESNVYMFVGAHSRDVFQDHPQVSALRPIPDRVPWRDVLAASQAFRSGSYDLIVLLDRSRWLRVAALLSRPDQTVRVRRRSPETRHESDVYADAVRELGVSVPAAAPVLHIGHETRLAIEHIVSQFSQFAVLHPAGAENPGAHMPSKRWPSERYVDLAQWLMSRGLDVVMTGGRNERDLALRIAERAGVPAAHVMAGILSLMESAALVDCAELYVGPDTGMSHLAAATGTPTVAIFGPTNPNRYRPRGDRVTVLAPDGSWELPDADLRRPSPVSTEASMEAISVDAVIAACDRWLSKPCQ